MKVTNMGNNSKSNLLEIQGPKSQIQGAPCLVLLLGILDLAESYLLLTS